MSFSDLKKKSTTSFQKLNEQLQKMNTGYTESTTNDYWYPEVDKAGNGYAVIRFLPAPEGEDLPFVRIWDHGFQGPGGWYLEKSLTTLGKPDPCTEYNSKLWNEDGSNTAKEQVRKQKRRLSYHANIYVIKDPAKPENEGKVFLYRFGKKIFDKLNDLMNPQFPDEEPINPFDFWNGANFNLKMRNVEGYRNYDKSEFSKQSPLGSDEELEVIWQQQKSLQGLIAADKFKSYDELKTRLHKVLQLDGSTTSRMSTDEDELSIDTPTLKKEVQPKQMTADKPGWATSATATASDEDDSDLDFFKNLAKD
jgi:hypothetical protein